MTGPRRLIVLHSAPEGIRHDILEAVEVIAEQLAPTWPQWRLAINRLAPLPPTVMSHKVMTHKVLTDSPRFRAHWDEAAPSLPLISDVNPLAERCAYLAETLRLGADDALLLPDADLSDLEMLAEFFLTRPLSETPCVFAHMAALAPRRTPQRAALAGRIARLGRRLGQLDVIGTRFILTAENAVLAEYFSANGLSADVASLMPPRPHNGAEPIPAAAPGTRLALASDETSLAAIDALAAFLARQAERAGEAERAGKEGAPPGLRLLRTTLPDPESDFAVAARRIDGLLVEAIDAADLTLDVPDDLLADPALMPRLLERAGAFAGRAVRTVLMAQNASLSEALKSFERDDESVSQPGALPPSLAQVMEAHATPRFPEEETPVIVHVAPAWSGAGSSHVFEAQLRALEERGFAVLAVHLDTNTQTAVGTMSAQSIVSRLAGENTTARWLVCRQRESILAEQKYGLVPAYKLGLFSLEGEGRVAQSAEVPASLREALAARKPKAVLLNYAHLTPFIARLDLEGVPVVLETHDVRSVQHAIYNKSPLDETDRALEFDLFAHSDLTVFINKAEEDEFSALHEGHPTASIFPFLAEPVGTYESPTATRASAVLELANKPRAGLTPCRMDALLERAPSSPPVALFVGTDHRANVNSLHWYLSEVALPYLAGSDVVTLIAGNIDAFFLGQSLPNVHFLGRVPTLEPFYKRADLILLPVREGTGLPIKTLDAIRWQKPFVASSKALQAIPGLIETFGAYDEPAAFAARVLTLAHDKKLRAEETEKLEEFANTHARAEDYGAAWDSVLSRVGVATAAPTKRFRTLPSAPLVPPGEPVAGVAALGFGKGLGPLAHFAAKEGGSMVARKPYSRLKVRADEPGPARLAFKANALTAEDLLVEIFCDGAPAGRVRLGAAPDQLALPLPAGEGPREYVLEFWVRDGAPPSAAGKDEVDLFALSDVSLHVSGR